MLEIKAHFDGTVIVPDEPVSLPRGKKIIVRIELPKRSGEKEAAASDKGLRKLSASSRNALKKWMAENPY